MKRLLILATALLILPLNALADIIVEDAWVRLPPPVADTAAAYMTIKNSGDKDVEITSIETGVCENPEFHSMEMDGEMMQMQKMEKVIVPAHGGISFSPNGNHIMLIGLTGPLKTGEHIMMTLHTSEGESIMVHAEVRDMRGDAGHEGHDMNNDMHGDMHGDHNMNGSMHHH